MCTLWLIQIVAIYLRSYINYIYHAWENFGKSVVFNLPNFSTPFASLVMISQNFYHPNFSHVL